MGTRIGTDGFSPSKVFETTLENKIDGNIYWGMLAQFAFISEQDCCFHLLQSNQVFHFRILVSSDSAYLSQHMYSYFDWQGRILVSTYFQSREKLINGKVQRLL